MSLRVRLMLLVGALLVASVAATAATLTVVARRDLLDQAEADGRVLAGIVAESAEFAREILPEVEEAIGDQMVVEARILAEVVAAAEAAGMSPDEINARLAEMTLWTTLDEIWITDETGHAYLRSERSIDFTFDPDLADQPQVAAFWPLNTGEQVTVVQDALPRELDGQVFKYVGVDGVDGPRIVQVGYRADLLTQLDQRLGAVQLVEDLLAHPDVLGIRIGDRALMTIASGSQDGEALPAFGSDTPIAEVFATGATLSDRNGAVQEVVAPIRDPDGRILGAVAISLSVAKAEALLGRAWRLGAIVALAVLTVGLLATTLVARRIAGPVSALADATAGVGEGAFEPAALAPIARRHDELGDLARRFAWMAERVKEREDGQRRQVQELTLQIRIDRSQANRQVAEITETDYFRDLQAQARRLRARPAGGAVE